MKIKIISIPTNNSNLRNSSKWHSNGGHLFQDGRHIFSSPYTQGDVYYIDESQLFGKDRYGSQDAFGNLFARNADNTYTRNTLMDDYFNNITDDEYTQIMNLYNDYVKQHNLKWPHAPKTKSDAARWLRDSKDDLSKIQDWHAFVNALYKRPNTTSTDANIVNTDNNNPTVEKRFWIRTEDGPDIPLNIKSVEDVVNGYKYNPDLDKYQDDESGNIIYDYYFEPNNGVTNNTIQKTTEYEPINDNLLRYASLLNFGYSPTDYTYANALNRLAGQYTPIAGRALPRERMTYFDVNLGNNQALAQNAAALRALRDNPNRWNYATNSLAQQQQSFANNALFNVGAQQAQEANRQAIDKLNFDLARTELENERAYDSLNTQINDRRINMLAKAAEAADNATTLSSTNRSQSLTNFLNNLSALGKENLQFALVNRAIKDNAIQGVPFLYNTFGNI